MDIINKDEIDSFLWEHRGNGCDGVKSNDLGDEGLLFNVAWRDNITGEEIKVIYKT